MKPQYGLAELLPHSGRMRLLTSIVDYGDGWLEAEVVIAEDSTFADADGVPASIGLEYMAQTVAAYTGLQKRLNGEKPGLGLLLGTRKYNCNVGRFPIGQTLRVKTEPEMLGTNGFNVFNCELTGEGVSVSAVLNVFEPVDAEAYLQEAQK